MKNKILFLLIIIVAFSSCKNEPDKNKLLLNKDWHFKASEDSVWLPAKVPSCVHTDLMANNIIEDPFYRLNEHNIQWIDKKDWEYKTDFFIEKEFLQKDVVELKFNGLDTYANVYLNNNLILNADNMFISWEVNCKEFLNPGKNSLRIYFESPINNGYYLFQV